MDSKDMMDMLTEKGRLAILMKKDAETKRYLATIGKAVKDGLDKLAVLEVSTPRLYEQSNIKISSIETKLNETSKKIESNIRDLLRSGDKTQKEVDSLTRKTENLVNSFAKSTKEMSTEIAAMKKIVDTYALISLKEREDGKDGKGIERAYLDAGKLILVYTDGTQDNLGKITPPNSDMVGQIRKGGRGEPGTGIASITLTSGDHSPGTSDTYTIAYTDASVPSITYQVYNGADGLDGTTAVVRDNLTTQSATDALSANQGYVLNELVNTMQVELDDSTEYIDNIKTKSEDLVQTIPTTAGYIGTNGTVIDQYDGSWRRTDYFDATVYAGNVLSLHLYGHSAIGSVCFYDSAHTFIESHGKSTGEGFFDDSISIPSNAVYLKICYASPFYIANNGGGTNTLIAGIASDINSIPLSPYVQKWKNKRIFLLGDSISSTDYAWYKDALSEKISAYVKNGGQSGATTATIASNAYWSTVASYYPDLIIALVGGNDSGASTTVGTFSSGSVNGIGGESVVTETDIGVDYNGTTFVQAISHIIRKYKATYYNFRANAGLTGSESESEKTAILDAIQKPKLVFCTTLPQKRYNDGTPESTPANWVRKVEAVKECCIKYDIPCLDLYEECRWDMALEPFWVSPTDMITNNGIYTMDGLHPNKYGYGDMALKVSEFIKNI